MTLKAMVEHGYSTLSSESLQEGAEPETALEDTPPVTFLHYLPAVIEPFIRSESWRALEKPSQT